MGFDIFFLFGSNSSFLILQGCRAEMRRSRTMQPRIYMGHMQGLHAEMSCCRSKCPFGQYLDLGFKVWLGGQTGRALQTGHTGAVWRQRKVPPLILLRLPKVKHQMAAGVGQVPLAFGLVVLTHSDLIGSGKVIRHRLGGLL